MIREAAMGVQSVGSCEKSRQKMVRAADGEHATGFTDLLTIGFGTTVAMWGVGYVGHMPLAEVPPLVFVTLMLFAWRGAAGSWAQRPAGASLAASR